MHKKFFFILKIIGVVVVIFVIFQLITILPIVFQLLFNKEVSLKQSNNNINILIMGIGGGQHEGPELTDSIIFSSIDQDKKRVSLISVPRDVWMPDIKAKINTAYVTGESKRKGGGLTLAKGAVSKLLGQEIDYVFIIDFSGFIKGVDLVGGLDINVENVLDDYEYPIAGKEQDACGHSEEELPKLATASSQLEAFPCRYTHLHFDEGLQHMDGETALQFVRSRHAKGEEGTDFARSRRQEKIISAFKDKVLSAETLLNPVKVISLYSTLKDNIKTDIVQDEFDDFIRLAQNLKDAQIHNVTLDDGDDTNKTPGLLINPPIGQEYRNQWVLIPRRGNEDFSEIHEYVFCEIKIGNCSISNIPSF